MAVYLMSKIKPQNGTAAMVDAADVEMPDGSRLSSLDLSTGRDGLTPFIGANGNWWIGEEDTGVKAQGADGAKGDKGDTGATGANGKDGAAGKDGADGHTPVKGTDYFTEADKSEMIAAVLAALPAAEGVSF